MPDLSNKAAHQYWHDYPDPIIYQVISFMESVENWTADDEPALEKALAKLGLALDNIGNIDLQEEKQIIQTTAFLKIGRFLRLLQCMDIAHPGAASKLLTYAETSSQEGNSLAGLFLRRNVVFERLRLLSRIFAEDRLTTLLKILENNG